MPSAAAKAAAKAAAEKKRAAPASLFEEPDTSGDEGVEERRRPPVKRVARQTKEKPPPPPPPPPAEKDKKKPSSEPTNGKRKKNKAPPVEEEDEENNSDVTPDGPMSGSESGSESDPEPDSAPGPVIAQKKKEKKKKKQKPSPAAEKRASTAIVVQPINPKDFYAMSGKLRMQKAARVERHSEYHEVVAATYRRAVYMICNEEQQEAIGKALDAAVSGFRAEQRCLLEEGPPLSDGYALDFPSSRGAPSNVLLTDDNQADAKGNKKKNGTAKKVKRDKDPDAPTFRNGFILFTRPVKEELIAAREAELKAMTEEERRETLSGKQPNLQIEAVKEAGRRWREASDEARAEWTAKAKAEFEEQKTSAKRKRGEEEKEEEEEEEKEEEKDEGEAASVAAGAVVSGNDGADEDNEEEKEEEEEAANP